MFEHDEQILWWNSRIRYQNKPFFWKKQFEKGLVYVSQIYPGEESISDEQAMQLYGLNCMQMNSLKAAIPRAWKCTKDINIISEKKTEHWRHLQIKA